MSKSKFSFVGDGVGWTGGRRETTDVPTDGTFVFPLMVTFDG